MKECMLLRATKRHGLSGLHTRVRVCRAPLQYPTAAAQLEGSTAGWEHRGHLQRTPLIPHAFANSHAPSVMHSCALPAAAKHCATHKSDACPQKQADQARTTAAAGRCCTVAKLRGSAAGSTLARWRQAEVPFLGISNPRTCADEQQPPSERGGHGKAPGDQSHEQGPQDGDAACRQIEAGVHFSCCEVEWLTGSTFQAPATV